MFSSKKLKPKITKIIRDYYNAVDLSVIKSELKKTIKELKPREALKLIIGLLNHTSYYTYTLRIILVEFLVSLKHRKASKILLKLWKEDNKIRSDLRKLFYEVYGENSYSIDEFERFYIDQCYSHDLEYQEEKDSAKCWDLDFSLYLKSIRPALIYSFGELKIKKSIKELVYVLQNDFVIWEKEYALEALKKIYEKNKFSKKMCRMIKVFENELEFYY